MNYNFEALGVEDDFLSPIKVSVQSNNAVKLEGNKLGLMSFCRYLAEDETTFGVDEIIVGHPWCDSMIAKDSLNLYLYQAEMVYVPQRPGKTFAQYGFDIPSEMGNNSEELLETNAYISATAWHEAYIRISEGQEIPVENVVAGIGANEAGLRTLSKFIMLVANGFTGSVRLKPRAVDNLQGELTQESMDLVISRNNEKLPNEETISAMEEVKQMEAHPENYTGYKDINSLRQALDKVEKSHRD